MLTSKIRISDDVLFQELNGEGVLLNLKTGVYLGLNPLGTRIWKLFADDPSLQQVVDAIVSEFDVQREQCAADVLALVDDMRQQELVTLIPAADSP
jgi:hypothetical protein